MTLAQRPMKVLVVWELGANLGHLLRLRPVVQALKRRGHVVVMAVPDPDAAHSLLDVAGVECIACPMVRPRGARAQPEREVRCYADILAEYAFGDGPALARTLGEWAALLGVVRPDALLIEFAPLALLVARLHRLPAVHVAIGWEAPPAGDTLPLIRQGHPGDKEAAVALEAVLVGRINEHCAAAELEPLRVLSDLYASARQLLATLPETDHFGPRDTVEYIGPLYSSDYGTAVAWPARVREDVLRVFVYLQPAKINSDLLKALRDMEAQVIAVLPGATHRFGVDNAARYTWTGDTIIEKANEGYDTIYSFASVSVDNVERMVLNDGDVLDSDATTGAGSQYLGGNRGNNRLDGGSGADTMAGGQGDDTYIVDDQQDQVVENAGEGFDTVRTALDGYVLGNEVEALVLDGAAITGTGNTANNALIGNNLDNVLRGLDGDDTLAGWRGNDTVGGDYNAASTDVTKNRQVEVFDFTKLVQKFDTARISGTAGSTSSSTAAGHGWAVMNSLLDAHLQGSDTAALGGDLSFQYATAGTLAGIGLAAAQASAAAGTGWQTLASRTQLEQDTTRLM